MITVMRRYRSVLQIGLLVVIAAFVITSVVVSGANTFRGGSVRVDSVATVNGETIPNDRYQRRYQAYLDAYSQSLSGPFHARARRAHGPAAAGGERPRAGDARRAAGARGRASRSPTRS